MANEVVIYPETNDLDQKRLAKLCRLCIKTEISGLRMEMYMEIQLLYAET